MGMREIKLYSNDLVDFSEAARRLGISRPTLYNWIAQGRLTPIQIGKVRYIPVQQIEQLQR